MRPLFGGMISGDQILTTIQLTIYIPDIDNLCFVLNTALSTAWERVSCTKCAVLTLVNVDERVNSLSHTETASVILVLTAVLMPLKASQKVTKPVTRMASYNRSCSSRIT